MIDAIQNDLVRLNRKANAIATYLMNDVDYHILCTAANDLDALLAERTLLTIPNDWF